MSPGWMSSLFACRHRSQGTCTWWWFFVPRVFSSAPSLTLDFGSVRRIFYSSYRYDEQTSCACAWSEAARPPRVGAWQYTTLQAPTWRVSGVSLPEMPYFHPISLHQISPVAFFSSLWHSLLTAEHVRGSGWWASQSVLIPHIGYLLLQRIKSCSWICLISEKSEDLFSGAFAMNSTHNQHYTPCKLHSNIMLVFVSKTEMVLYSQVKVSNTSKATLIRGHKDNKIIREEKFVYGIWVWCNYK